MTIIKKAVTVGSGLLLFAALIYTLTKPISTLRNPAPYISQAQHHLRELKLYWDLIAMQGGKMKDVERIAVLKDVGFEMNMLNFQSASGSHSNRVLYVPASLRKMKESKPEQRILFIYKDPFDVSTGTQYGLEQSNERFMAITATSEMLYLERPSRELIHLFE